MKFNISSAFLLAFLAVSILTITIGGYFLYIQSKQVISSEVYEHLDTAAKSRADHIQTYLYDTKKETELMSTSIVITNFLISGKNDSDYQSKMESAQKRADQVKKAEPDYDEVFVMDTQGKVVLSSVRERIGTYKSTDTFFTEGRKKLFLKDMYASEVTGKPQLGVASPIFDSNGNTVGVFAVRINPAQLNHIVEDSTGMGNSGEIVLINKDSYAITPLKYKENAVLNFKIDTEISRICLEDMKKYEEESGEIEEHEEETLVYKDYRGVSVLGTHDYALPEAEWCVIAKIDESEALKRPLDNLLSIFIITGIAIILVSGTAIYLVSLAISKPIKKLSENVDKITKGDLNIQLKQSNIAEVQSLTNSLNRILASLKLAILRTGMSQSEIGLGEALAAKKEAEDRYKALYNNIQEIVMVNKISPNGPGKFLEVNDYACSVFGYSKDEMLKLSPADLDESIGDRANTQKIVSRLFAGEDVHYASVNRTKGGKKRTIESTLRLIDINGEKYILSTGQDITEKLEAQNKYKSLYESSSDAIMTIELPAWKFTSGNPAAVSLFGVKSEQEFVSLGPWDVSPKYQPDGRLSSEKSKQMIQQAMKEGHNLFEWAHKKRDGTEFASTVLLSRLNLGGREALQATVRDITKEKLDKEKIKLFEKGFDSSPDSQIMVAYADRQPQILRVNPSFTKYYGYKPEEVMGKNPNVLKSGKQDKGYYKKMWAVLLDPKIGYWRDEIVNKRKDGSPIEVLLVINTIFDKNGKPTHFFASHVDISKQKKAERGLVSAKETAQTALGAIADSFFVCDTSGKFISWNKEFTRATGYSDEEVKKMKVTGFFTGADVVKIADAVRKGLKTGTAVVQADVVAKDKSRLPTEFKGSVIKDTRGKIMGFTAVGRRIGPAKKGE